MINILFAFGQLFAKGGTEAVMMNIFNNIDRNQFHIDFLIVSSEEDTTEESKYLRENGANIFYVPRRKENVVIYKRKLNEFFKTHKYDIVHSHMDAAGADILKYAQRNGIKIRVTHSHNTNHVSNPKSIYDYIHRVYADLEKIALRYYANYYIACSPEAGYWLFGEKICKGSKYSLFNNAIDVEKYAYNSEVSKFVKEKFNLSNKKIILHVGRFEYQKNHEYLIDVFKELSSINEEVVLVLVGEGSQKNRIADIVQEYQLDERVLFLGAINYVSDILQIGDVFVFPSHYEGLAVSLVEAEASGMPCVASSTISKDSNITGKVLYKDITLPPQVWAECINDILIADEEKKTDYTAFVEKGFDMKTNVKNLEKIYEGLCK